MTIGPAIDFSQLAINIRGVANQRVGEVFRIDLTPGCSAISSVTAAGGELPPLVTGTDTHGSLERLLSDFSTWGQPLQLWVIHDHGLSFWIA